MQKFSKALLDRSAQSGCNASNRGWPIGFVKRSSPGLRRCAANPGYELRHIFEYIAHDSHHYARKVTQEIMDKTGVLNELPRIGRAVPEIGDDSVRELFLSLRLNCRKDIANSCDQRRCLVIPQRPSQPAFKIRQL